MEIKDVQELLSKASADVQEKIKGLVTEAESLKTEMKKMREEGSSELEIAKKELNEINKKQGLEIERLKRAEQGTSFKAKLIEQIEGAKSQIEDLQNGKVKSVKLSFKSADVISISGNLTSTATPYRGTSFEIDPEISKVARPMPIFASVFGMSGTDAELIHYIEEVTGEGAPIFIAEKTAKTRKDYDFTAKSSEAKEIAIFGGISERMLRYAGELANQVQSMMSEDLFAATDNAILYGDPVANANSIKGIAKYTEIAFPTGTAFEGKYTNPTIAVLLNTCLGVIAGRKRNANFILMNTGNFTDMVNELSLQPAVTSGFFNNGTFASISGVPIVQSTEVAQGYVLVGDATKFKVRNNGDAGLEFGYINDDFQKNIKSMRAAWDIHAYLPANYQDAFIYDSLDNIKSLVEKPV